MLTVAVIGSLFLGVGFLVLVADCLCRLSLSFSTVGAHLCQKHTFHEPRHHYQSVYLEVKMQKELQYLSVTRGLIFWEILVTSSSLRVE